MTPDEGLSEGAETARIRRGAGGTRKADKVVSPRALEAGSRVLVVERLVDELFDLACQGPLPYALSERRPRCHARQITMYVCRVVLSMPYQQIASALGRDRSTVIHGCAAVEDRRDLTVYDGFIDRCERCVRAVFSIDGEAGHAGRN
jgi:DnaA-like protein